MTKHPDPGKVPLILERCRRLGACGWPTDCACDVNPADGWTPPPGCYCRTEYERDRCEENCDSAADVTRQHAERKRMASIATIGICTALLVLALVAFVFVRSARSADYVRPQEFVIGQAPSVPYYCKPLLRFERSCAGVKAASFALGKSHARWLAKRCGATDSELSEAESCFSK